MRLCRRQANRVSVNLPVCPEFSPGTGREGGEERWQKRPLWATLWEMQHLHASEHKRSGGSVARNEQVCRSCPVFANAPHRASVPTSSGLDGSAETRIAPFSTPLRYNGNTQESPTIQWAAGISIPKTPKCILFSPRDFKVNVPWRFRASSDTPPYLISQTSTGHPGTNARTGGEPDWTSADSKGGSARLRQ